MKRTVLLYSLILLVPCMSFAQNKWEYPILPGTPEWASFKTHSEMIRACLIPDETLKKMSTEELIQAWIDFPLRGNIEAFNSMQKGFESQLRISSALAELVRRPNSGTKILARYNLIEVADFHKKKNDAKKGGFMIEVAHIEFLLSQPSILSNLNNGKLRGLLKTVIVKLGKKKIILPGSEFTDWESSAFVLMGRVLIFSKDTLTINYMSQNIDMANALSRGYVGNIATEKLIFILNAAESFSK